MVSEPRVSLTAIHILGAENVEADRLYYPHPVRESWALRTLLQLVSGHKEVLHQLSVW